MTGAAPAGANDSYPRLLSRGYQGAVYLDRQDAGLVVIKKPIGRWPLRALRVLMLRREFAAYQRLDGVPGVPRCLGLRDGQELVLEFIEGRPLREARDHLGDADAFFGALRDVVQAIHRAGVAHADMKRKDNILVTRDEQPFLIDFGIAAVRRDGAGPLGRYLFRQACRIDLNAWVKLKYQRSDREMSAEDALLYRPTLAERVARPVRTFWRRINGRRWRQARRRERAERASGGREG